MEINKKELDAYITKEPDFPEVDVVCPKCGNQDCADKNNCVCDIGDTAICSECNHAFIVQKTDILSEDEWEKKWGFIFPIDDEFDDHDSPNTIDGRVL